MPGRYEALAEIIDWCVVQHIDEVVCLAGDEEIAQKSPAYYTSLQAGRFPAPLHRFPVPDFGLPENEADFFALARRVLRLAREGKRVLIHCAAGRGRTGTLAAAILLAAGMELAEALEVVREAGSFPDTEEQQAMLSRFR